jgi:hypothetical protein
MIKTPYTTWTPTDRRMIEAHVKKFSTSESTLIKKHYTTWTPTDRRQIEAYPKVSNFSTQFDP